MTQLAKRDYSPTITPCSTAELPFVKDVRVAKGRTRRNYWAVQPTDDYETACSKGHEFAAHYLQYLKANSDDFGRLGWIAGAMAEGRAIWPVGTIGPDKTHGYAVGFFAFIDSVLRMAMRHADPFAIAQAQVDYYAECARWREAEEEVSDSP